MRHSPFVIVPRPVGIYSPRDQHTIAKLLFGFLLGVAFCTVAFIAMAHFSASHQEAYQEMDFKDWCAGALKECNDGLKAEFF